MTRLLAIGDGGAPTGMARVMESILRCLPGDLFEIHHLAVNYSGDPHNLPWKLYRASARGSAIGENRVAELVDRLAPDVIFAYQDLWKLASYLRELRPYKGRVRVVTYAPVESAPVRAEWLGDIDVADVFAVFTEYSEQEILRALGADSHPALRVVPHGVDTEVFRPLAGAPHVARRTMGMASDDAAGDDLFVVLNANRNQLRKQIDLTIESFAQFSVGKPDGVKLYLHMGLQDAGWDILALARRFGVEDRLIVTANDGKAPFVTDEDLNLIYNACDVGLNTSACEGWGLCAFEHAATGAPQVMLGSPNLRELWGSIGNVVEPDYRFVFPKTLVDGYRADPARIAAALEALYKVRGDRRRDLVEFTRRFSWEAVAAQWRQFLGASVEIGPTGGRFHGREDSFSDRTYGEQDAAERPALRPTR